MDIKVRENFSYSQMSSYKYSAKRFIENYYYGSKQDSVYLDLGKKLGTALQFRNKKTTKIIEKIKAQIPTAKIYEYELKTVFNGIPLIGYLDGFDPETLEILEFKTGKQPSEASWKSQMTFYSTMIHLLHKKLPPTITLYWAKTEFNSKGKLVLTGSVKRYDIKVTMNDVIMFSKELVDVYNKIQKLIEMEYQQFGILPKGRNNNHNNKTKK